ncbi:MAG: QueT transporter family protein [bacterium]
MKLRTITRFAAVAAAYVVLTYVFGFIAYGDVQFRIAELLILLCFFKKQYAIPLIIGCAIANIPSPLGIVDVVFGTAGTIFAAGGVIFVSQHQKWFGRPWIALAAASLFPVLMNGLWVGWELHLFLGLPFAPSALLVAFGELVVVTVVGVPLFSLLSKNRNFMHLIDPGNHADFGGDGE